MPLTETITSGAKWPSTESLTPASSQVTEPSKSTARTSGRLMLSAFLSLPNKLTLESEASLTSEELETFNKNDFI